MDIQVFSGSKEIPYILDKLSISIDGTIYDKEGRVVSLEEFNLLTKLEIKDVLVLVFVTYRNFNWAPVYWKKITILKTVEDVATPESLLPALEEPVECLEIPGFYLIPFYSNYVISKEGILLKRSERLEINASVGMRGYCTFRMMDDSGVTQNRLRHRILGYTFLKYTADVEDLQVNHKNLVKGDDRLENLEWVTSSENCRHAQENGASGTPRAIQVKNIVSGMSYIFRSAAEVARELNINYTSVISKAETNGYKAFSGYQFRFHPCNEPWPDFERLEGKYKVELPSGKEVICSSKEAALYAGLTRTSLMRMLREGRQYGTTPNKITKVE